MSRQIDTEWVLAMGQPIKVNDLIEIAPPPNPDAVWRNARWEPSNCWYIRADGTPYSGDCLFIDGRFDEFIPERPAGTEWDNQARAWVAVTGETYSDEDWPQLATEIFATNFDEWFAQ